MGDGVNIAARLEGICEPGGIYVSGAAFDHVRGRIDADFVDLGEKELKNIARPVRVYAIRAGSDSAARPRPPPRQIRRGPPRLSIVVLPFANIGGDPEQEYFVDGVTESLTTDLSRIGGSFVIARNTAFTYKGRHGRCEADRTRAERPLCARGQRSARPALGCASMSSSSTPRAAAIFGRSGSTSPWQTSSTCRTRSSRGSPMRSSAQLFAAEARRAERKPDPNSMDLIFQGWSWMNKGFTTDSFAMARGLFERAAALDPANRTA